MSDDTAKDDCDLKQQDHDGVDLVVCRLDDGDGKGDESEEVV